MGVSGRVGNRRRLKAGADDLQIEGVNRFPTDLDLSNIKVVYNIAPQIAGEEFYCRIEEDLTNQAAELTFQLMRVGGLTANGVGVNQWNVGESASDVEGSSAQQEAAAQYDYRVLAASWEIIFDAAGLAANVPGAVRWFLKMVREATDVADVQEFYFAQANVSDGKGFDADELVYRFGFSSNAAGVGQYGGAFPWPGFIPGAVGNGVSLVLVHADSSGGARTAWPNAGAAQFRSTIYGIRYPKGLHTW